MIWWASPELYELGGIPEGVVKAKETPKTRIARFIKKKVEYIEVMEYLTQQLDIDFSGTTSGTTLVDIKDVGCFELSEPSEIWVVLEYCLKYIV